jgi:hypothetical protein
VVRRPETRLRVTHDGCLPLGLVLLVLTFAGLSMRPHSEAVPFSYRRRPSLPRASFRIGMSASSAFRSHHKS